jgi:hypothetical protein
MPRPVIDMPFPMAGLDRAGPYQRQAPFTSPDALNVRPDGTAEGRQRGGSRPGLKKRFTEQLGDGTPVRMLQSVNVVAANLPTIWTDDFSGESLSGLWSLLGPWEQRPELVDGYAVVGPSDGRGVARKSFNDFDVDLPYTIRLAASAPAEQGALQGHYYIHGWLSLVENEAPNFETRGFTADINFDGEFATGALTFRTPGLEPLSFNFDPVSHEGELFGIFEVAVAGLQVGCFWNGTHLTTQANTQVERTSRCGFSMMGSPPGGTCRADYIEIEYFRETQDELVSGTRLVASANGKVYTERPTGELVEIETPLTIASEYAVGAAEHLQKLYIADRGSRVEGVDGRLIPDEDVILLESDSIAGFAGSWENYGIEVNADVCVISNAAGGAENQTYVVTRVTRHQLHLAGTIEAQGTGAFRVERAPKVLTPEATEKLKVWQAESYPIDPDASDSGLPKGQVPSGSGGSSRRPKGAAALVHESDG